MRATEAVDRFMYGAIAILFTILITIGSWGILKIIDHETRLAHVENNLVTTTDYHNLDKRVDRLEGSGGRVSSVLGN